MYAGRDRGPSADWSAFITSRHKRELPIIGWREWVGLPDLGIETIKAKVDTGARSSSLHAFRVRVFERDAETWVRFDVQPIQRNSTKITDLEAPVLEFRSVRSSSGRASQRPVIVTSVSLLGLTWPVELTLANRDEMGFRMLLGREAFRSRFLVDAGRSYYGGRPPSSRRKNAKKKPDGRRRVMATGDVEGLEVPASTVRRTPKKHSPR